MKKLIIGLLLGLVVGVGVTFLLRAPGPASDHPATEPRSEDKPPENPLRLSPGAQNAAGMVTANPKAISLPPEITAYGRVLDPTPLAALVAEETTARASLAASEKELDRVRKLFAAGGNASAQSVEAAEAGVARDRAAAASAHVRLLAGWGSALAEHADLKTMEAALQQGAALVRIDLLPGTRIEDKAGPARVALLGSDQTFDVHVLGPAPIADPQVQGESFLGFVRGHSLPAGASLQVTIEGKGDATPALAVPRSAIVYHEGSAWVYVMAGDQFARRRVVLGRGIGQDIVVQNGVAAGEKIAVHGAEQLLSAELVTGVAPDQR